MDLWPTDTLVYEFAQKPRWVATHNRNSIVGHQKIYQGPLLLAVEAKGEKPATLPKEAQLNWDAAKCCVTLPGGKLSLMPINDIIDWNYEVNTYNRQILWRRDGAAATTSTAASSSLRLVNSTLLINSLLSRVVFQ
jgi:hypothetical protein